MIRIFLLVVSALVVSGCGAFKPYESVQTGPRAKVTITKHNSATKFDVIMFDPDDTCDFTFMGRVNHRNEDNARTVYMPAKRANFRVSAKQAGYHSIELKDVSFLLEENQECTIDLNCRDPFKFPTPTILVRQSVL